MPVTLDGVTAARDALRRMPRELKTAVRDEVTAKVAEPLAAAVRAAGASAGPYGGIVGQTARAKKDVEPVIVVGSSKKAPVRGRATVNQLLYGTEFGSPGTRYTTYSRKSSRGRAHAVKRHTTRQFRPGGHDFILGTFARRSEQTYVAWEAAAFEPMMRLWGGVGA